MSMATATNSNNMQAANSQQEKKFKPMPLLAQISMMTWRSIYILLRSPGVVIPNLIISAFFLFIYKATLGDTANFIPGLQGSSYLGFILPLSIISAALNSSAGQAVVRDIESGYFDKLLLTPISRSALLLGPILAGSLLLAVQTTIIIGIALLMGLEPVTGVAGLLVVIGLQVLVGTGFAGFTVGIALRTNNAGATQGASFIFFPLTFLTATFVPVDLLEGWLQTAARINPITYILDAMRSVLIRGWEPDTLLYGLLACAVLGGIPFIFSLLSLKARTARK